MTQWGLDNLFNPGKRHMDDEKRRLQSTREEIGDASGGRRIDLEGGTVSISVPGRRTAPTQPDDAATEQVEADATGAATEALAPALEAEDVPAVALASDAEIEPEVVVEPAVVEASTELDAQPEPAPVATAVVEPEPEPEPAPEAAVAPEPTPPAAARRRAVSASAWARRG